MMKRWWVIAVVFALALSLTSCSSKKKLSMASYGFGYCDGQIGSFDVYVIPSKSNAGMYEVSVVPASVASTDEIMITATNGSKGVKPLALGVVPQVNQEILAGTLTEAELDQYDVLAITPYQQGVAFNDGGTDQDAICTLPRPGDGVDPNQP